MNTEEPKSKPIRLLTPEWQNVSDFSGKLTKSLGSRFSLPGAIAYAIRFTEANDPNLKKEAPKE
jgi:hypothetical protein